MKTKLTMLILAAGLAVAASAQDTMKADPPAPGKMSSDKMTDTKKMKKSKRQGKMKHDEMMSKPAEDKMESDKMPEKMGSDKTKP